MSAKWEGNRPYIFGGPLPEKYVFCVVHFHWAENDSQGSEHSADGEQFPLEMHVVYFKAKYNTYEEAVKHDDGVVFEVHFFYIQADDNANLGKIIKNLGLITHAGTSTEIECLPLMSIFQPFTADYLLYGGRIMAQKGGHKVIWIISRRPTGISHGQMIGFRTLCGKDGRSLLRNIHYLYEVGNRRIYHVNMSQYLKQTLYPYPKGPPNQENKLRIQFRKVGIDTLEISSGKESAKFSMDILNSLKKDVKENIASIQGHIEIERISIDKATQIEDNDNELESKGSLDSVFSNITKLSYLKEENCDEFHPNTSVQHGNSRKEFTCPPFMSEKIITSSFHQQHDGSLTLPHDSENKHHLPSTSWKEETGFSLKEEHWNTSNCTSFGDSEPDICCKHSNNKSPDAPHFPNQIPEKHIHYPYNMPNLKNVIHVGRMEKNSPVNKVSKPCKCALQVSPLSAKCKTPIMENIIADSSEEIIIEQKSELKNFKKNKFKEIINESTAFYSTTLPDSRTGTLKMAEVWTNTSHNSITEKTNYFKIDSSNFFGTQFNEFDSRNKSMFQIKRINKKSKSRTFSEISQFSSAPRHKKKKHRVEDSSKRRIHLHKKDKKKKETIMSSIVSVAKEVITHPISMVASLSRGGNEDCCPKDSEANLKSSGKCSKWNKFGLTIESKTKKQKKRNKEVK